MNVPKSDVTSFEKYLKVWNNILTGAGMSPVSFHRGEKGELLSRISPLRMLFSGLILVLALFIAVKQNSKRKFDLVNLGSFLVSGYINLTGGIIMSFLAVSVILKTKSYASLISTFVRFHQNHLNVKTLSVTVDSIKFIMSYVFLLGFCFCLDCYLVSDSGGYVPLQILLSYFPGFYGALCTWNFAVYCYWLKNCLWKINRSVEKHTQLFNSRMPLPGAEFLKINAVFPECLEPQWEANANTLRHVRGLYHQVYLMSTMVNEVFATRNLAIVAYNFGLGTTLIYCGFNEVFKYIKDNSNLTVMVIVDYFIWSTVCFLFIYGLIRPCTRVYKEMQTTVMLVQQVFTKSPEGELQSELQSFVMQLSHERISFSPHGFFELNNQLVLSIIGSVVSYLVILIQFRITLV